MAAKKQSKQLKQVPKSIIIAPRTPKRALEVDPSIDSVVVGQVVVKKVKVVAQTLKTTIQRWAIMTPQRFNK